MPERRNKSGSYRNLDAFQIIEDGRVMVVLGAPNHRMPAEYVPTAERDFWRSLCEQVDAHYGASLDRQPPYVARIRQALRHEDGA